MKLEEIPHTCPMYEKIVEAIGEIEAIIVGHSSIFTGATLPNPALKEIAVELKKIRNTADSMREVNGHLRDAAKIQQKYTKEK